MKLYQHTFQVSGNVSFPIDMLRYDSCCPHHEQDSNHIINSFDGAAARLTVICVARNRNKNWSPTVGRWKSMGWHVDVNSIACHPIEL